VATGATVDNNRDFAATVALNAALVVVWDTGELLTDLTEENLGSFFIFQNEN